MSRAVCVGHRRGSLRWVVLRGARRLHKVFFALAGCDSDVRGGQGRAGSQSLSPEGDYERALHDHLPSTTLVHKDFLLNCASNCLHNFAVLISCCLPTVWGRRWGLSPTSRGFRLAENDIIPG